MATATAPDVKEDPREALLKYSDELNPDYKKNKSQELNYFGNVYDQTQPKRQLHHMTAEQEEEQFKKAKKDVL